MSTGPEPEDLDALLAALQADPPGALDGVRDMPNMPTADEPPHVRQALRAVCERQRRSTTDTNPKGS